MKINILNEEKFLDAKKYVCFTYNNIDLNNKKLLQHYIYLYNDQFIYLRNKYFIELRQLLNYNDKDIRKLAVIKAFKELIDIDENIQINDGTWACPICGLHIKDMGAHVKSIHDLDWKNFKKQYNWLNTKIYFSKTYKENLSKNKIHYYNETEQGLQARQALSKKFSGKNNPACRDDVKLKISKSKLGQHISSKNKYKISKSETSGLYSENAKSFGYTFWAFCNGKERRFRSKNEYLIFLMFQYYNITFDYEPYKIEYLDPNCSYLKHYIIDFVSNNRLFEVKPSIKYFLNDRKYLIIQDQLSKCNKKLEVLTPSTFNDILNIDQQIRKPVSFFEKLIVCNIINGNCKLQLPIMHDKDFYLNSKFIKSLGDNPLQIIEIGELLYENKKNN